MLENVIIVGPTRTGSTALFRMLAKHKSVRPSRIKEVNFFLDSYQATNGEKSYEDNFPNKPGSNILLEASPKYFAFSSELAKKVKDEVPEAKIIILMREPMARLQSIFNHILTKRSIGRYRNVDELCEKQLLQRTSVLADEKNLDFLAFCEGNYLDNIQYWVSQFGEESTRVFLFEDLEKSEYIEKICEFLKIEAEGLTVSQENKSRFVRNQFFHKIALFSNNKLEFFLNKFPATRSFLRSIYYSFNETVGSKDSVATIPHSFKLVFEAEYSKNNRGLVNYLEKVGVLKAIEVPGWLEGTRK